MKIDTDEIEGEIIEEVKRREDVDLEQVHELKDSILDRECNSLCRGVSDKYTLLERAKEEIK